MFNVFNSFDLTDFVWFCFISIDFGHIFFSQKTIGANQFNYGFFRENVSITLVIRILTEMCELWVNQVHDH